ncbi:nucleotide disphospho-sugar-binding domain-containing protein [Agromyces sp. H66]|uniref:nucleotide disphospho-sugar-binding domain-containing protein n=1 Tax=Agromyces sp. H66 TaxID=2529859 RepID=UPI0010AA923C|nr:nucleotide disphospho-sugar-binding domain-containing protein [Agromyces sp. H66]
MAHFLSVLPLAGGNVSPTLLIAEELESRGHRVRILGHAGLVPELERAGLAGRLEAFERARPWNPRVADPGVRSMLAWLPLASDRGIGRDLEAAIARERPDALLVDCMVPGALDATRRSGIPAAMFLHTLLGYWEGQWSPRSPMGLWLRATGTSPFARDRMPQTLVLATDPEFDQVGAGRIPRDRIVQVGPVIPDAVPPQTTDRDGHVLVSFSTIAYPGQLDAIARVIRALADLGVRAVVTAGPAIDPAALPAPPGIEVRGFGDHGSLLRSARLLIGHGGHGTTMRALAAGVPVLVVPMTRHADHHLVAAAVARAGVGGQADKDVTPAELRAAIAGVLESPATTARVRRLGERLRRSSGAERAADVLERLPATPSA